MHVFWERGYEAASISRPHRGDGHHAAQPVHRLRRQGAAVPRGHRALRATAPAALAPRALEGGAHRARRHRAAAAGIGRRADAAVPPAGLHGGDGDHQLLGRRRARAGRADQAPRRRRSPTSARASSDGIDEGELPADTDAAALANFYATVYQGMSMQAKDGATQREPARQRRDGDALVADLDGNARDTAARRGPRQSRSPGAKRPVRSTA